MIVDGRPNAHWLPECMSLSELKRALHTSYRNVLRILEAEGIRVYRFPYGQRRRHYVFRDDARCIILRHGSESARQRAMKFRCAVFFPLRAQ